MRNIIKEVIAGTLAAPEMRTAGIAGLARALQEMILLEFKYDHMPVFSSTGASVTHCPGSYQAPAADPGYICLYKVGGSGLNFNAMTAFSIGDRGLGFRFPNAATGIDQDVFANGTWAVTTSATTPRPSANTGATK